MFTNLFALGGLGIALAITFFALSDANFAATSRAGRQQSSAYGLLAVHEASRRLATANAALTGAIAVNTLNVAPGFSRLYGSDIQGGAVRTWILPTSFNVEQRDVLLQASDLHFGSANVGVVLAAGGWQAARVASPQGNASLTSGIPVGTVFVYSKIR